MSSDSKLKAGLSMAFNQQADKAMDDAAMMFNQDNSLDDILFAAKPLGLSL